MTAMFFPTPQTTTYVSQTAKFQEVSLHHVVHQPGFLVARVRSDWKIIVERKLLGAWSPLLERF